VLSKTQVVASGRRPPAHRRRWIASEGTPDVEPGLT